MLADELLKRHAISPVDLPSAAWLAGAAAGLEVNNHRSPRWLWEPFIEDLLDLLVYHGNIEPAEPGTSPNFGDGAIGSAYDALGGYVSITGEFCPEGLYFKVPLERQKDVARLLSPGHVYVSSGEIVIPPHEVPSFLRLVPIHGPLSDTIDEEALI
ncbi:MAG: hypothetical protein ACFFEU_03120 [Candidatus Thorarchaeota archaeon]